LFFVQVVFCWQNWEWPKDRVNDPLLTIPKDWVFESNDGGEQLPYGPGQRQGHSTVLFSGFNSDGTPFERYGTPMFARVFDI
jgi:hypothetical protein